MNEIYLSVLVPPLISQITGQTVINQGDTMELICEVTGIPNPEISWMKNRIRLDATFDSRISFPTSNSLKIMYMKRDDAAEYSCQAQSDAGSDSEIVDVHVRGIRCSCLICFTLAPVS